MAGEGASHCSDHILDFHHHESVGGQSRCLCFAKFDGIFGFQYHFRIVHMDLVYICPYCRHSFFNWLVAHDHANICVYKD